MYAGTIKIMITLVDDYKICFPLPTVIPYLLHLHLLDDVLCWYYVDVSLFGDGRV